jgi:hypothetical protein
MIGRKTLIGGALALAFALLSAGAQATTLQRADLEDLTKANGTIVVGQVLDAKSYWNEGHSFILTDVRIAPNEVLKGELAEQELTVTLLGGTVGDLTTLILGGAELIPGKSYVLFLNPEDLPGARKALTVRDHCQGTFDVVMTGDGLRAISQANRHPLVPDAKGSFNAPGGAEGFPFVALLDSIRDTVIRQRADQKEVR